MKLKPSQEYFNSSLIDNIFIKTIKCNVRQSYHKTHILLNSSIYVYVYISTLMENLYTQVAPEIKLDLGDRSSPMCYQKKILQAFKKKRKIPAAIRDYVM